MLGAPLVFGAGILAVAGRTMANVRNGIGSLLGIAVFLAGVGMVVATFWRALGFFSTPPEIRLGLKEGQPIDAAAAAASFGQIGVQILALVVMALVGSLLASQGVKLYAASANGRAPEKLPSEAAEPEVKPEKPGP